MSANKKVLVCGISIFFFFCKKIGTESTHVHEKDNVLAYTHCTGPRRGQENDGYNRKQWFPVPVPV